MSTAAVIAAAGSGDRLGPGAPKALRPLAGATLLVHAARAMASAAAVDLVLAVVPPGALADAEATLAAAAVPADCQVVAGGATRRESVASALGALPADVDIVLVHDAARALAPSELADTVLAAVRGGADAAIPALAVTDTIKQVDETDRVLRTLDRQRLRAVQTPQGFRRALLARAHAEGAAAEVTDDAGLVEALGVAVQVLPGHPEAFKITTPLDLRLAEILLAERASAGVG
jgi:2-C-methyl-D-erythritol 4-phosphate cytidylyltransferase